MSVFIKKNRSRGKMSVLVETPFEVNIIYLLATTAKAIIYSR